MHFAEPPGTTHRWSQPPLYTSHSEKGFVAIENSSRLSYVGSIAKGFEHYGPVSWSQIIVGL